MMAANKHDPIGRMDETRRQRQLAAGLRYRLTLVLFAAEDRPISYRLLSRWADQTPVPVRFLQLTSGEDRAADLLDCLEALLDGSREPGHEAGEGAEGACEDRLIDLINGLVGQPTDLVVVLTGTAAIASNEASVCLERLVDYLPPHVHLYLAGTTIPPLTNLARLRVRRQLLEIDWRDHGQSGDRASREGGG